MIEDLERGVREAGLGERAPKGPSACGAAYAVRRPFGDAVLGPRPQPRLRAVRRVAPPHLVIRLARLGIEPAQGLGDIVRAAGDDPDVGGSKAGNLEARRDRPAGEIDLELAAGKPLFVDCGR